MAMTVRYNDSANRALSHMNKNINARSKSQGKLASGMKINSASDDAASYSISSRMKVKLRALEQDTQNVQNGSAILRTAEGGIQGQIDLLRTIRAKVIDAANDSNTDEDRQTIQKELNHLYTQMENIAYETDYNSKKPLLAKNRNLDEEEDPIARTALNLIPDEYAVLDNIKGPFDIFEEYSVSTTTLGTTSGYVPATSKVMSVDFSGYSDVSQLNNVGIRIGSSIYVFTDDTSKNYRNASGKIDISDCASVDDAINKLKNRVGGEVDGTTIKISTATISGASNAGGTVTTTRRLSNNDGTPANVRGTTSGGVDNEANDPDLPAAAPATLTVNLSGVTSDTGFRFNTTNFRVIDSNETIQREVDMTLTKGQSSSGSTLSYNYTFDGTNLSFTAKTNGTRFNNVSIDNRGYTYYTYRETTTTYDPYTAFSGTTATVSEAIPATPASFDIDLSGMTVDDFSAQYAGKIIQVAGANYKFYDSGITPKLESVAEVKEDRRYTYQIPQIDINTIRQSVAGGKSLAQAAAEASTAKNLSSTCDGDTWKITSTYNGAQINLVTETLRSYEIDFSNLNLSMPGGLYGKGFRAYCATDSKEWFNFVFNNGSNTYKSEYDNIKAININVSNVRTTEQLLQAIYDQANSLLTEEGSSLNHHMRIAADPDNKTITLYDRRRYDVSYYPDYQQMGAKVADGVAFEDTDEVEKISRYSDFVIQSTDRADMNIRIKIPQMTLDQIFDPLPDADKTIFDYPVTDSAGRVHLLGTTKPPVPGILNNGLKYLLNAATTVGAQNRRLEFTAANIATEIEHLTAAESVIRDADMAKEMTEYTKQNILAQASQAILAQANQLPSMIMSLLQ